MDPLQPHCLIRSAPRTHSLKRLKDVLFLDMALAAAARAALESSLHLIPAAAAAAPLPPLLAMLEAAAEAAALGAGGVTAGAPGALRYELVLCVDQLRMLEGAEGE